MMTTHETILKTERYHRHERGMSLVMASAILLIIFFLSTVSLSLVTSNAVLTRAVYSQSVVLNRAEDGPADAASSMIDDAENGFYELLATQGPFFKEQLAYDLFGDVNVAVSIRDNNDLDDSLTDDVDKVFILTTEGYIIDDDTKEVADQKRIAQSSLEVLVRYVGADDEYAQETGSSKSHSNYASEVEVSVSDF